MTYTSWSNRTDASVKSRGCPKKYHLFISKKVHLPSHWVYIQIPLRQGAETCSTEEAVWICTGRVSEVALETLREEQTQNQPRPGSKAPCSHIRQWGFMWRSEKGSPPHCCCQHTPSNIAALLFRLDVPSVLSFSSDVNFTPRWLTVRHGLPLQPGGVHFTSKALAIHLDG